MENEMIEPGWIEQFRDRLIDCDTGDFDKDNIKQVLSNYYDYKPSIYPYEETQRNKL